jgi:hypothetical protein
MTTPTPHADVFARVAAAADAPSPNAETALPKPVNLLAKLAAPPLVVDDVPPVLGDYAAYLANQTGIDFTAYALAGIVAAASMLDDRVQLVLAPRSRWFESARLWVVMVGSPGAGKTPAMRAMLRPVYAKHRALAAAYEATSGGATGNEARADAPPRPALFTSDATVEALAEILRANERGILFIAEEFESWIGSHDAYRNGTGSRDRGDWLHLYDGGPHQVNRIRRGASFIPNWGASIIAGTTFAALRKLAKHLPTDGLPQRFLMMAVRPMEARGEMSTRLDERHARQPYERRLYALHDYGGGIARLTHDAADLFRAEEDAIRALVGATEVWSEAFAAHVAKHVAMLARVALTFHAFTASGHPAQVPIGVDTLRLAGRFMRKVFAHGMTIYTDAFGTGSALDLARAVARSILAGNTAEVNRRAITHTCRAWRNAEGREQDAALQTLLDSAWLIPLDPEQRLTDYGARWTVNPNVHAMFREDAEAARLRRDLARERLHGS